MANDLHIEPCVGCGIEFGLPKAIIEAWKTSHKQFYCPNGCILSYPAPKEEDKEVNKLRSEVASLKTKLATSETKVAALENKVAELTQELEIWRPNNDTPIKETLQ